MVGLVLVAHSAVLLDGLRAMIAQTAPAVPVGLAGGTGSGTLGTSAPRVLAALHETLAIAPSGAVVLVDLGSAMLAVEIALEEATEDERARTRISAGPIVEGVSVVSRAVASRAVVSRAVVSRAPCGRDRSVGRD